MATLLEIIQTTLAPMFLITGAGIYLNFVQARLFRAVDRIQNLHDGETTGAPEREIPYQLGRVRFLRLAVVGGSLAMAFTALSGIFIILSFYLDRSMDAFVLTSFALALACLAGSLVYGLRDTYRSMRTIDQDMAEWDQAFEGD